jgi:DNA-binding CsgD family transcriptional regulator
VVFYLFNNAEAELALVLNRRSRDFSERDRAMANFLRPHLAQAWQNAKVFTEMRQCEERTQKALAAHDLGLMFLTAEFKIARMKGKCETWLKEYFGRQHTASVCLPDKLKDWMARVRSVRNSEAGMATPPAPMTIEGPGGRLQVRFIQDCGGNVTLLFTEQRRVQMDSFAGFGLTPREREILLWLSEGKSNPEIGRILGISARTVEKHVERLLAKMNVESRRAAMLKVLS